MPSKDGFDFRKAFINSIDDTYFSYLRNSAGSQSVVGVEFNPLAGATQGFPCNILIGRVGDKKRTIWRGGEEML